MKQIVLGLFAALIFSCTGPSHRERVVLIDTTHGVYIRSIDKTQQLVFGKAELVVIEHRVMPKDSTSSSVVWATDTIIKRVFAYDTARDPKGKPVYDSIKKAFRQDSAWKPFNTYDPKQAIITILK